MRYLNHAVTLFIRMNPTQNEVIPDIMITLDSY
jgi:hypothetical protein